MRGRRNQPRREQIEEMTRGQTFPLGAIPEEILEIIAEILAREWNELLRTYADRMASGGEVDASSLMCSRLNGLEDPLWRSLVSDVVRDHSVPSYDGGHLSKSPDLSLHLTAPVRGRADLARSTHARAFTYIHQEPPASPGPITIWHLWLGNGEARPSA